MLLIHRLRTVGKRVRQQLVRKPVSFVERPTQRARNRLRGKTSTARIGRHRRVQVHGHDLPTNVCPTCKSGVAITINDQLMQCRNNHQWRI